MLNHSRLFSFLDHQNGFNVHFLEGQKLIHDLVLTHEMKSSGFAYFRDIFLGLLPIVFFLKPGESLGLYIDSEDPYFRLKIETNSSGHTRTLLLPENFNSFPMNLTGKMRITKLFPHQKAPYTSVIDLNQIETKNLINQVLSESYQTNSEVDVSEISDQSVMVTKLPSAMINSTLFQTMSRKEFKHKHKIFFHDVFEKNLTDLETIVKLFEDQGFTYLGSRQVSFFCPCSHERMVLNLKGLYSQDLDSLFVEGPSIEIKCDYCKKNYSISKDEVLS